MPPPPPSDPTPAPATILDEDYDSDEDSDFDPSADTTAKRAHSSSPSSSESEASGDEGDKKSRPRKRKRRTDAFDSISGDGGLVKTRAQRRGEAVERKGGVAEGKTTTDVDALWAAMNAGPEEKEKKKKEVVEEKKEANGDKEEAAKEAVVEHGETVTNRLGERVVKIQRTYEFAGETITEEKWVDADSFTAKAHSAASPSATAPTEPSKSGRRPPPKKKASAFDTAAAARARPRESAPQKLNTLEKSRLDWAGFVDKEGIGDDLQRFNKGEKGYMEKQRFLGRVDQKREELWKEGKKK